jgi:transposase
MHRIILTQNEEQVLEQTLKATTDRRLRERCQAVLMAARGRVRHRIAQDLGVHRTTVRLWLQRYREQGVQGLKIHWAPGQPRRIPAELAPTIVAWVKDGPASCGLQRANWTYRELADYLYKQTGLRVQETAMREFCHRQQIRPYRPTYRYLRGDPQRQAATRVELEEIKKSASGGLDLVEPG